MSAYDEWLTTPPEPSPHNLSGKCSVCNTEHFNGPGEGFATSACACGAAECCEDCDKCGECGDAVCSQCSVTVLADGQEKLLCSGCYGCFLDDQPEAQADAPERPYLYEPHPDAVHPIFAPILDAIRPAIHQTGARQ
ncbi:MAG: hypothetical protein NW208_00890 [Bryobacter sp.]|nr:hypothetical protein [Bryobacter sp.]